MKKLNLTDFGTVLLKLRNSVGWTQMCVSQNLGISQKSYSDLENNHTELSLLRFLQVSAVFNVHPFAVLQGIIEQVPEWNVPPSSTDDLVKEIDKLIAQNEFLKSQNQSLIEICKKQSDKPCVNHQKENDNIS